jgi:hypothetical protein
MFSHGLPADFRAHGMAAVPNHWGQANRSSSRSDTPMPQETATNIAGWRLPARLPRAPPGGEPDGPGSREPQGVRGPRRTAPCTRAQLGTVAGHRSGERSSSVLHGPAVRHRVIATAAFSRACFHVGNSLRSLLVPATPGRACGALAASLRRLPVPADSVSGRLAEEPRRPPPPPLFADPDPSPVILPPMTLPAPITTPTAGSPAALGSEWAFGADLGRVRPRFRRRSGARRRR